MGKTEAVSIIYVCMFICLSVFVSLCLFKSVAVSISINAINRPAFLLFSYLPVQSLLLSSHVSLIPLYINPCALKSAHATHTNTHTQTLIHRNSHIHLRSLIFQERDYRRRVENYTTIFEPLDQKEMLAERNYSYFKCDHSRHHFVVSE